MGKLPNPYAPSLTQKIVPTHVTTPNPTPTQPSSPKAPLEVAPYPAIVPQAATTVPVKRIKNKVFLTVCDNLYLYQEQNQN